MQYVVLDTNILLLDSANLYLLSDMGSKTIVIPEIVIEELDSKKTLMEEIGYHARRVSGMLSESKVVEVERLENSTIIHISYESPQGLVKLELVSKPTYAFTKNDLKIIEVAEDYKISGKDVLFISNDTNCRFQALTKGLAVDYVREHDDVELPHVQEIVTTPEIFDKLNLLDAKELNPQHNITNYGYYVRDESGRTATTMVHNGKLEVIDEIEVRKQELAPRNREQLLFSSAILSGNYDFIVVDSKAGSGKTAQALSSAMRLVRQKKYSTIYYLRNSVNNLERNEEVGFLKGDEADKTAPFFYPLFDTLTVMVLNDLKGKKIPPEDYERVIQEKVEEKQKRHNIKPITTLGLRGRTLRDAIVIVDEGQNFSPSSAQTALTRIGENCLLIVLGSSRQIDNAYLNKFTTGLATLLAALKQEHDEVRMFGIELTKVVRGRLTEFAERIFTRKN